LGSNRGDASTVGGLEEHSVEASLHRIAVARDGIRTRPIAGDG
jgi:hypothetical protein